MHKKNNVRNTENLYKPEDYSYTVAWSEEDQTFIGRVTEFESLAAHGETQMLALKEITDVVGFVLEDLRESGEPIPEPFSKKHYSGKLNVRMTADLHRNLSLQAVRQGVSLNHLIVHKLCAA